MVKAASGTGVDRSLLARITGDAAAAGGVRLVELADGVERGIRVLEFRTGTGLAFDVLVDRAMDLGAAEHAGRSIGWRSPTGFRHPGLHEHADDQGWSWLRSFSGLLVTAGLDHVMGPAEVDAAEYAYQPTAWHPLHGRIGNVPARLLGYGEHWVDDTRCVLWAEGEMRQARVFGENLRLVRRIEADLGGNEVRIRDTVTNAGSDATPHMLLYHFNIGWPLLDEGARFLAPVREVLWRSPGATSSSASYREMGPPQRGAAERVYEHDLVPDEEGRATVAVANDRLGLGVALSWEQAELPCFVEWLHLREGAYVIGCEPSTHHAGGNQAARDDGTMTWLDAGERRTYGVTVTVLDGADEIGRVARLVAARGAPA